MVRSVISHMANSFAAPIVLRYDYLLVIRFWYSMREKYHERFIVD